MTVIENIKANIGTVVSVVLICGSFAFWVGTTTAQMQTQTQGLSARVARLENVYESMREDITDIRVNVAAIAQALNVKTQ